jgi:TetR/AcrR family transcriptional regulator, transcriptional repressor for nem operon
MGDLNDAFRTRLAALLAAMKSRIAVCLNEARDKREIPAGIDPEETADFIINSWEGTLVRMKVTRDTTPWQMFDRIIFKEMLMMQD